MTILEIAETVFYCVMAVMSVILLLVLVVCYVFLKAATEISLRFCLSFA